MAYNHPLSLSFDSSFVPLGTADKPLCFAAMDCSNDNDDDDDDDALALSSSPLRVLPLPPSLQQAKIGSSPSSSSSPFSSFAETPAPSQLEGKGHFLSSSSLSSRKRRRASDEWDRKMHGDEEDVEDGKDSKDVDGDTPMTAEGGGESMFKSQAKSATIPILALLEREKERAKPQPVSVHVPKLWERVSVWSTDAKKWVTGTLVKIMDGETDSHGSLCRKLKIKFNHADGPDMGGNTLQDFMSGDARLSLDKLKHDKDNPPA